MEPNKQKNVSEELDRTPPEVSKKLEDIRTRYAFWAELLEDLIRTYFEDVLKETSLPVPIFFASWSSVGHRALQGIIMPHKPISADATTPTPNPGQWVASPMSFTSELTWLVSSILSKKESLGEWRGLEATTGFPPNQNFGKIVYLVTLLFLLFLTFML